MNYKLRLFVLGIILFLSFAFRFYNLETVPNGLHSDEAAWGYNAYSILLTGKDEYGESFPLVLKSFGEYKTAVYSYLNIPFINFFDLNAFSVRMPSVLFGTLNVLLVYLLAKKIFQREKIALLSSFLFGIAPWSITLSRVAAEFNVAFSFIFIFIIALLYLKDKFEMKWFLTCLLFGFLAIISYTASRFIVILTLLSFISVFLNFKSKLKIKKSFLIILVLLFLIGLLYSHLIPIERFSQVSVFSNPLARLITEEQIREDHSTPLFLTRVVHNKVINYGRNIITNYGQYFTLEFLFLNGGLPDRERIPSTGLLYIWQIPFLIFGIYSVFKSKNKNGVLLVLLWLLFLIPAAITYDEIPNVHRVYFILPSIIILISVGIVNFLELPFILKIKKLILPLIFIIAIYELIYFTHQYFIHQNIHRPWYRGYPFIEMVPLLKEYESKYDKIVFTKSVSSPYIYLLFYSKYDPKKYQEEGSPKDLDFKGFGNFIFVPYDCPLTAGKMGDEESNGEPGILYINSGTCVTPKEDTITLKEIKWEDGSKAFSILEFVGERKPGSKSLYK